MPKVRLGRTEIVSEKNAFGALPIQRVDKQEAAKILLCALDGGITYFDTARGYTDSEEKMPTRCPTGGRSIIWLRKRRRLRRRLLEGPAHLA
jgi:aryl-alcohol dehydrogenase-like predicted oxidoreductase